MSDYSDLVKKIESMCEACNDSNCLYCALHPKIIQLNLNDPNHVKVECYNKDLRDWIESRLSLSMLESMYGKGK